MAPVEKSLKLDINNVSMIPVIVSNIYEGITS